MKTQETKPKTTAPLALAPCCASGSFVRLFKPQFAAMVESGTKLQTVRPTPRRMPRPGDRLILRCWVGAPYRSKQRLLRSAVVRAVAEIEIDSCAIKIDGKRLGSVGEHSFALADGFSDAVEMTDWFRDTHGLPFRGVVLYWHNNATMSRGADAAQHKRKEPTE